MRNGRNGFVGRLLFGALGLSSGCSSVAVTKPPLPDRVEVKVTHVGHERRELCVEVSFRDSTSEDQRLLANPSVFIKADEATQIFVGDADGSTVVPDAKASTGVREAQHWCDASLVGVRCSLEADGRTRLLLKAYSLDAHGRTRRRGAVDQVVVDGQTVTVALEPVGVSEQSETTLEVTGEAPRDSRR